jgi:hypothetical protein
MDSLDRSKLDPRVKLELVSMEAKIQYGRDPRGGGMSVVARPRIILQILIDMGVTAFSPDVQLQRPVVMGSRDEKDAGRDGADVVGWWHGIPLVVRSNVSDDRLWCLPNDMIPASQMVDRQRAGQMRIAAHAGGQALENLRD